MKHIGDVRHSLEQKKKTPPKVNCELRSQYHTVDYVLVRMFMYDFYVAGEEWMDIWLKDVHNAVCRVQHNWADNTAEVTC
jgi:hypothetical protein